MDREVEIRKLVAKLDRKSQEQQRIINKLFSAVYDTATSSFIIELTDTEQEEPDGFHGKSYADFEKHETMKSCFVCGKELTSTSPPVEIWYRPEEGAHSECIWSAAKSWMEGRRTSQNVY